MLALQGLHGAGLLCIVYYVQQVRMVLERKKPTTFPGMHLLCESCTGAREQQVSSYLQK